MMESEKFVQGYINNYQMSGDVPTISYRVRGYGEFDGDYTHKLDSDGIKDVHNYPMTMHKSYANSFEASISELLHNKSIKFNADNFDTVECTEYEMDAKRNDGKKIIVVNTICNRFMIDSKEHKPKMFKYIHRTYRIE